MLGRIRVTMILPLLGLGTLGCAGGPEVRYVYQDGHSGVIGMPENTSRWPTFYRKHAEELMTQHFPEGYEIVRAEEVVEGSRTLTIKGSNAAEIAPGDPGRLVSIGKLGHTSSRSQADSVKIKECRIVYKKAGPADVPKRGDYAEQASWTPAPYIDPNAPERRSAKPKPDEPGGPANHGQPALAKGPSPERVDEKAGAKDVPAERPTDAGRGSGTHVTPAEIL
jgi:hypothetical protein